MKTEPPYKAVNSPTGDGKVLYGIESRGVIFCKFTTKEDRDYVLSLLKKSKD